MGEQWPHASVRGHRPGGQRHHAAGCHPRSPNWSPPALPTDCRAIVAVQAQNCAPLAAAFADDADDISPGEGRFDGRRGYRHPEPPCSKQILWRSDRPEAHHHRQRRRNSRGTNTIFGTEGLSSEPTASACFAAAMSTGQSFQPRTTSLWRCAGGRADSSSADDAGHLGGGTRR